jgi:hypothetical protein
MKKIVLSITVAFIATSTLFAQIPNNGFENWTSMGSYSNPDGWATMNDMTAMSSVYTATKGTPGNVGASYLKLTSKTVGGSVVNGIAVSGTLNTMTMQPTAGFPYTGQPVSLTGKWQYMASSAGSVSITLSKWNTTTNQRDIVATGSQTLSGMAMSWASFTINLNYMMSMAPDSCMIVLKASGNTPTNNDYLWVDNLAFSGSVAGLNENNSPVQGLSIYPNPIQDKINVSFNIQNEKTVALKVTDIDGKLIHTQNFEQISGRINQSIDATKFPKGIYFVTISNESISETRKIVIQ